MKVSNVIWSVLAILLFLHGCAGLLSTYTRSAEPSVSATRPESGVQTEHAQPMGSTHIMHDDVDVDYLSYKVTRALLSPSLGDLIVEKQSYGQFLTLDIEVVNNAIETMQIFTPRFRIRDAQGRLYDRMSDDFIYVDDPLRFGEQLQPSLRKSGSIVFELAADAKGPVLIITGDWMSTSEVAIALNDITTAPSAQEANTATKPIIQARKLETVEIDDVAYTLRGTFERSSIDDIVEPKGSFLIMELELQNRGKAPIAVPPISFQAIDYAGYRFTEDSEAKIFLDDHYFSWGAELQPMLTQSYKLVFDIPQEAKITHLSITSDSWQSASELLIDLRPSK